MSKGFYRVASQIVCEQLHPRSSKQVREEVPRDWIVEVQNSRYGFLVQAPVREWIVCVRVRGKDKSESWLDRDEVAMKASSLLGTRVQILLLWMKARLSLHVHVFQSLTCSNVPSTKLPISLQIPHNCCNFLFVMLKSVNISLFYCGFQNMIN